MAYNNGRKYDREAAVDKKSMRQIEEDIKYAEYFIAKYPQFINGTANEHLHFLKLKRAERIGKTNE